MATRAFDLNIEEVLENWEVEHAIREVIANALDEQVLTGTREIDISKDLAGCWRIRDFGRGLRIDHFTLKEDKEKLGSGLPVIGKFGVGLKDALATFHRRRIGVLISSTHGVFRLSRASKHGFDNILTLHVQYDDAAQSLQGTEFVLLGVTDVQMSRARSLFVKFAGEKILDTTQYGQVLARHDSTPLVYIRGVRASEEPNFLFSYNITSLTDTMRKRLNRERLNVGRTTYADRVKAILKSSTSREVHDQLVDQVTRRASGDQKDEMAWIEISQMALNLMHQRAAVAFVTEDELQSKPDLVDLAKRDGIQVVVIPEQAKAKVEAQAAAGGPQLRTLDVYAREYNQSFQYKFLDPSHLTTGERELFCLTPRILALIGLAPPRVPDVRVSESMRITSNDTDACWDPELRAILVKRACLSSLPRFAGTLLHEAAHATQGAPDVSRQLETVLTDYLGRVAAAALRG
jgi:hypothetical protein